MAKKSAGETTTQSKDSALSESFPVPELYFGTVRAIGTPLKPIVDALKSSLKAADFYQHDIKVSECLEDLSDVKTMFPRKKGESPYKRYQRLRAAGFWLRSRTERPDAVVVTAIAALNRTERAKARQKAKGRRGVGYLFRSVHHPKEVERLRKLYDRQLFLVSVYSSVDQRLENLRYHLGEGYRQGGLSDPTKLVEELMRDEDQYLPAEQRYDKKLAGLSRYATNIPKTFQYGDLFLDVDDPDNAKHVERFVDLIFGHPFHTPTRDEVGMAEAFAARLESGNLARQVGASVLSEDGELLTTGTNDVPAPGGSVYRSDDVWDFRDYNTDESLKHFRRGFDASDTFRRHVLTDLLRRMLADPEWLRHLDKMSKAALRQAKRNLPLDAGTQLAEVLEQSVNSDRSSLHNVLDVEKLAIKLIQSDLIWGAQFFDVLEYGRTMHAEMDAITSAARKGVSLRNSTLYCTTFPCHECARLIIGAGIRRVIFIEPYEKSRVEHMYDSEINFTTLAESRERERQRRRHPGDESSSLDARTRVDFVPYVGVSPRRFHELFSFVPRKLEDQEGEPRRLSGEKARWNKRKSKVREAIISHSAITSRPRLDDLQLHERELIDELEAAIGAMESH